MSAPYFDRVVALAGIFQAASLVQQLARTGRSDEAPFAASIHSVFQLDIDTAEDAFDGRAGVENGLRVLCRQLGKQKQQRDIELTRYVISLLFLERKLAKRKDLLEAVQQGVDIAAEQREHFGLTHENVIERLAETYAGTISTLQPRIMVNGEPELIKNPDNANTIRALLLAGMRATVLWRQVGGNRIQLLFSRARIVGTAQEILNEIEAMPEQVESSE